MNRGERNLRGLLSWSGALRASLEIALTPPGPLHMALGVFYRRFLGGGSFL